MKQFLLFVVLLVSHALGQLPSLSDSQLVQVAPFSDGIPNDRLGFAVGMTEDTLLAGSPGWAGTSTPFDVDTGEAYLYAALAVPPGFNVPSASAPLGLGPGDPQTEFGGVVAISASTSPITSATVSIAVAATTAITPVKLAFRSRRGDTTAPWNGTGTITVPGNPVSLAANHPFVFAGYAPGVTTAGTISQINCIVETPCQVNPLDGANQNPTIVASSAFGSAIAVSDRLLVVGANNHSNSAGAVLLFTRANKSAQFSRTATVFIQNAPTGALGFGSSVDVSLDSLAIVVGAPATANGGNAYIYESSVVSWTTIPPPVNLASLLPSPPSSGALFGTSVIISDDKQMVFVGAPGINTVFGFKKGTTGWVASIQFNGTASTAFGKSLATAGNQFVIGAPNVTDSGMVFVSFVSCPVTQFGPSCALCTCVNGTCNSGLDGNGTCSSCTPGYFGSNCDMPCNCTATQQCNDGVAGDGKCYDCGNDKYGPTCANPCSCDVTKGNCSIGIKGTGLCLNCLPNYGGSTCRNPCPASCLTCFDGINGNSSCSTCHPGNFSAQCIPCTCQNGTCNEGITGTGTCSSCAASFFGPTCSSKCPNCTGGTCFEGISGNGTCNCGTNCYDSATDSCKPAGMCTPPSTTGSGPSGNPTNSTVEPAGIIPGVSATAGLAIVIAVPVGGVLLIVIIAVIIWKATSGSGGRKFDSDKEDSVSM